MAIAGLGTNQPKDAIYPLCLADADGKPLEGSNNYVLHFTKDELPPVEAFWSITIYDAEGFQVDNKLNRLAIGDRDNLTYNTDGSSREAGIDFSKLKPSLFSMFLNLLHYHRLLKRALS